MVPATPLWSQMNENFVYLPWIQLLCYNTYVKVNQACIYQIWSFKLTLLHYKIPYTVRKNIFFYEIQLQRNYQQKSLEKESSWKNYSSFTKNVTILNCT